MDEEQERTVGLLLLGTGAVLAHGFDRPLAVEMDDDQQSCRGRPAQWRRAIALAGAALRALSRVPRSGSALCRSSGSSPAVADRLEWDWRPDSRRLRSSRRR
jgi:hypothetical protein